MPETEANQCPFSKLGPTNHGLSLSRHAQNLSKEGLGPLSKMIKESLLETQKTNPALPDLHAAEGAKFAAMAKKIAPVDFIATQLEEYFDKMPLVAILDPESLYKTFADIAKVTQDSLEYYKPNQKRSIFTFAETCDYFRCCSSQPAILLACFYLSVGLQKCMIDIANKIVDENISKDVKDFGRHFNASNLLSALPMALYSSLIKFNGREAEASQLNKAIVTDALKSLHDNGRFIIRVNGIPQTEAAGKVAVFQCPMEGYLFNLLCSNQVLENIIASIGKADKAFLGQQSDNGMAQMESLILMIHHQNTETIRDISVHFLNAL